MVSVRFPVSGVSAWAFAFLAVVAATTAHAARSDFVGAEVCRKCHEAAFTAWERSDHAQASESLGRRVTSRRCLTCHSTGEAPAGRPFYSGVQCEACHGAGAGYASSDVMRNPTLARELGLRELSSKEQRDALCATCHQASTRIEPFDAEASWKRIVHP